MRHFLLLAFAGMLGTLAPMAGAEVLRCADAAGNLSYTDGACPAGTKAMGRVAIQDPVSVSPQEAEQRRQAQADTDRRFNRMRPSIAPRKRHQAG
jgi:hypothetical protein